MTHELAETATADDRARRALGGGDAVAPGAVAGTMNAGDEDMTVALATLAERVAALDRRTAEAFAERERDDMRAVALYVEQGRQRWDAHMREHHQLEVAQNKFEATSDEWRSQANEWRGQLRDERGMFTTRVEAEADTSRLEAGRQANADRIQAVERAWAGAQGQQAQLDALAKAVQALQLWQANMAGRTQVTAAIISVATSVLIGLVVFFVTHGMH